MPSTKRIKVDPKTENWFGFWFWFFFVLLKFKYQISYKFLFPLNSEQTNKIKRLKWNRLKNGIKYGWWWWWWWWWQWWWLFFFAGEGGYLVDVFCLFFQFPKIKLMICWPNATNHSQMIIVVNGKNSEENEQIYEFFFRFV